jgi:UDP-3-O-[3-hydroxymyristoyl] N-acetylglucosamine deacetylase
MLEVATPLIQTQAGLHRHQQATVGQSFTCAGVGLHSGVMTTVCVHPAPVNAGRSFVRTDLPGQPCIPAQITAIHQTQLSTELMVDRAQIRTVEHLLAALVGFGIDNARIEVDGGEIPVLDGSARPWVEAIAAAGVQIQDASRPTPILAEPLWVQQGDAFVAALPAPSLKFTYGIEFQESAIGQQWFTWSPATQAFETDVAPARTFGLASQIEWLRSQGLIKGGSLDNALVCDAQGWLNPPLRFDREPVRHKLLDLLGDLSLLGVIPQAHFLAYKASHQLHTQLAAAIAAANLPGLP